MQALNFPSYEFKTKVENEKSFIFDIARKKFVRLLPEEWVRQHLIHYLIFEKKYPLGLTKIEHPLKINEQKKFTDITIFNNDAKPILIAECKSFKIKLDQNSFIQAANYNKNLNVKIFIVSNGLQHFALDLSNEFPEFLNDIPNYDEIKQ